MKTLENLKKLAVKFGCCASASDAVGNTIDEVIAYMEAHYTDPVRMPTLPTAAGNYKLVVDAEGAASWVAIV